MKKIVYLLLAISTGLFAQIPVPRSTTTFSNVVATGNFTVNGTSKLIGATQITSSTTIGTGTVAANTSSLGIVRIKQGSSWIDLGESSTGFAALYMNAVTTSSTNYVINSDYNNVRVNAPNGDLLLRIGNANRLVIGNSTSYHLLPLRVGSTVAPSATLDVTGTFSLSNQSFSVGTTALTGGNTGTVAVLSDAVFQFTGTGLTAAMGDAVTYYFGNAPQTLQTSSVSPFYMPYNATLIGYVANFVVNGGAGSAESSTLGINIAGTTTTLNASVTMNSGSGINTFTATGLSVSVNAGTMFCPYLITPTWATNPGTTATGITFLFVRRQ